MLLPPIIVAKQALKSSRQKKRGVRPLLVLAAAATLRIHMGGKKGKKKLALNARAKG
jgi:hypothetical protein